MEKVNLTSVVTVLLLPPCLLTVTACSSWSLCGGPQHILTPDRFSSGRFGEARWGSGLGAHLPASEWSRGFLIGGVERTPL